MPELPEVQTVVNHIREDLVGEQIIGIESIWPKVLHNFKPEDLIKKNIDTHIEDVKRRAKFIIIQLPDFIIAIHLRMTGKLYFLNQNELPKHASATLQLKSKKTLVFEDTRKFGRFYLYKDLEPINERHGPEPLDESFTSDLLMDILSTKKRNIKALLLDQSLVAGLGNIYVDEGLWMSGIHPNSISNAIPKTKIIKLHRSIQTILMDAIAAKGTTIIDFSVNGESGKYTDQLRIFGKAGEPCQKNKNKIKKIRVAGRGTYFCSKCQHLYLKSSD